MPIRPRLSVSTAEAAVWAAIQGVGATRVLHYQCAERVREVRYRSSWRTSRLSRFRFTCFMPGAGRFLQKQDFSSISRPSASEQGSLRFSRVNSVASWLKASTRSNSARPAAFALASKASSHRTMI